VLQTAATCVRELTGAERASAWYATREGRIDVVAPPGASRDWVPKDPTVVPLCVDGRMLGELRAESRARGDFGPEAEQVAASVGREVAAAMERLRLSRQQRHRQQVLDELGELSVEASDTGSFLDAVVQRVAKELSIEVAAVFWFEPRDDMLRRVAVHPRHIEEWKEEHYAVYPEGIALHGESLVGRVFAGGKTIRVDDVEADPRLHMPSIERLRAFLTRRRFAHFLGVPMRFQDRMRGVFRVLNKLDRSGNLDPEGLTAEDAEWLAILANHAAFVMVTMERQARQDAFREYSKEVLAEAELDRVGQLTVDLLTSDALRYRGAALWVTQDTGEKVELVPWYEKGLVSGKGGRAQGLEAPRWRSGQKARVTRDIAPGERMGEGLREVALRAGLGTAFCIPIRVGRTQLGVLTVFGGPAYTFSHDERSFLTTAAHHVAAAVDRVERLEAERRRTQAEAVMMGAADERDLLRSVAHHAPEIVEAESALVWAPRPEGEQVSLICEASSPGTVAPDSTRLFAELCLRGRRAFGPVHQGHIERHRCWREGDAAGPAPRSLLLVPVVDDEGSVLAVLELRNKTGRQPTSGFTPEDRRRAERLADKLPTRIGLLRMHAKLQRENEQRRMLRELAHNIRSPLISIRHLTRFLLDGLVEEDAERDDFLSTIHTENERFIRLLTDLLETWRIEAGQDRYDIQPVDIGDIARQALAASRYLLLEADLHCETRIAAGPLMAMADPDRCRYLLQLLLDNAIKYSPPGRRIGLQAGRRGSMIRLVVRDKGPGIPKRERRDLFTPFVRGAGVGGKDGLGLGMHLVKRYVDAMGGRLRVWSKTDSGTTVTVLLPAAPGGTEDA